MCVCLCVVCKSRSAAVSAVQPGELFVKEDVCALSRHVCVLLLHVLP